MKRVFARESVPLTVDFMGGVMRRPLAPVSLFFGRHLGGNGTFWQHVEALGSKMRSSGTLLVGCASGGPGHGHRATV